LIQSDFGFKNIPLICHLCESVRLTSLAVITSVIRGRAKMQKTVTPSLIRSTDSETDGHCGVLTVTLHWESRS